MGSFEEKIKVGAEQFGIELNGEQLNKFSIFCDDLLEWNKVMNLTAIKEPDEVAVKHFVDSLAILKYCDIKNGTSVADVGCGAGFPGHPIKIAREDISITSIDSLQKRLNFLEDLENKLLMTNCERVHLRAEEAGANEKYREKFDYSFARAVAKLRVLAEYCLPLVKVGGQFIAMKGPSAQEEIDEARPAIKLLGGNIEKIIEYDLPETESKRTIIIINKVKATEKRFPRNSGRIAKKPL